MAPPPLPCTVLPCTEASDNDAPGSYSMQLVPSHRRELQTLVSTVAGLTSALANTAVGHIVLASGTYFLTAELSITRSLILEAAAGATVTLNAQASSSSPRRVLYINPGSSGVVQLIRLGITGGYVAGAGNNGGGVGINVGTVTFSSCNITGNTATTYGGSGGRGGGVFINAGTVSFSSCTITGNTAYNGGGVAVSGGTVTISSCIISGNAATDWGGGIYVDGGKVSIVNSQVYSNQADSAPNVYVSSIGATVCSWATTLIGGVDGTVSTCQTPPPSLPPLPPSLPPSPPTSPPPPPPPDLALIPATITSNIPTAIAFVGTALTDGATCAFLPAGDNTCAGAAGAAASGLFPTGGVLSRGLVTVRLSGPMIYKLCAAPAGSDPKLDAHFTYVSSVLLTSLSPSPDKAMDIGPIAGGVGGGLLLLAGLCGLAWKLRRMRATPKSSGLELPQGLQGSVSPVRLLESD